MEVAVQFGGDALKDIVGVQGIIDHCVKDFNLLKCGWEVVTALPWGKILKGGKIVDRIVSAFRDAMAWIRRRDKAQADLRRVEEIEQRLTKAAGCSSFLPGTLVLMADGSHRRIEDIQLGDQVLAAEGETGRQGARKVVGTITTQGEKHLVEISVAGSTPVTATDSHPFWLPDLQVWVEAKDLWAGAWLQDATGSRVQVNKVHRGTKYHRVHNLTVNDLHTYYVLSGEALVLVHNAKCIVGNQQFDNAWGQHSHGGAYHKAGKTENVFAGGIDKARFRRMVDEAIKNGTQVPRAKSDPRDGYYIDYDFGDVEVGAMGQNGMRIAVDGAGNFVTAMPKFMY